MTQPTRILVVEDEADDVLFLRRALDRVGYTGALVVAEDGDAALDVLARADDAPAHVLLDLKLPRRSGIELLRWMREEPAQRARRVIVFTSSNQPQDRLACETLGIDAYLIKPVGFPELEAAAREILRIWAG